MFGGIKKTVGKWALLYVWGQITKKLRGLFRRKPPSPPPVIIPRKGRH